MPLERKTDLNGQKRPRRMLESEIPDFVAEIVATGCDMCAIGDRHYLIGDADLSDEEDEVAQPLLQRIGETYGSRGHLHFEIIAYLRSIGRFVDTNDFPMPPALQDRALVVGDRQERRNRKSKPSQGED
jgi:hypothetical protein